MIKTFAQSVLWDSSKRSVPIVNCINVIQVIFIYENVKKGAKKDGCAFDYKC